MNFRFLKEELLCSKSAGNNPGGLSRLLKIINTALDSNKENKNPGRGNPRLFDKAQG